MRAFLLVGFLGLLVAGGGRTVLAGSPRASSSSVDRLFGAAAPACVDGRRWVLLLDLSGSVNDGQRAAWSEVVRKRVAPSIRACDQILVLGVHEASATAAPVFLRTLPRSSESLREKIALLRALDSARRELATTVETASRGRGGAARTNLLDALDRIELVPHSTTYIVALSDMEDSSLPPAGILRGAVDSTVDRVTTRRAWLPDRFQHAKMFAVLPSERGTRRSPDYRRTLRTFWATLCARTGGELASFETYIPDTF